MNRAIKYWLISTLLLLTCQATVADPPDAENRSIPAVSEAVDGLQLMAGFIDLYWNERNGQLLLHIENPGEEFIYQSSLARGVGSNDLGLDRGQLGDTKLVEFFRSGPRVLLIEKNTAFRANSDDAAERLAVESSFGRSVLWGFEVVAESDSGVLVDATGFFLRDSHGLVTKLKRAKQGDYTTDASRSAIYLPRTRAFPDNSEVEAIVTYTGNQKTDENGAVVSDTLAGVVPDVTAFTVHLHHSFIRLPDAGYRPLAYDPRAGIIGIDWGKGFHDYAAPIGQPIETLYGIRHRLEKVDPQAELSEAVEPIVYYLDPGVPEPVRSALLEGAGWWNEAFEAAGYKDAFQVKLLPEDADPMDVRYNVIQWVHRSTRGWSYGFSVVDPRSGEILKGHVSLGSLRVRQDYLIAEGLLSPYGEGANNPAMLDMSLARIRQLSAHEVGHTIGMEHNFAASVNDRSSVMDYPFPLIRFSADGGLDLSDAYATGIGEWDKRTVLYAYQDFPAGADETVERQKILADTIRSGLLYIADQDARDPGSAHPQANLWDNGADAIEEFNHLMKVRSWSLQNLSEKTIPAGRPLATIEEALVPIYLLHRYQIEAVGKLIGGLYFNYTLRGDGQSAPRVVDASAQNAAIDTLVAALDPAQLKLPRGIVDAIAPRPPGFPLDRETFTRHTGPGFDQLAPAGSAVKLTLDVLLNPRRAARMNDFHATNTTLPGFDSVLNALTRAAWYQKRRDGIEGAIQRMTAEQLLYALMTIAGDSRSAGQVKAQALFTIEAYGKWLGKQESRGLGADWAAHYAKARRETGLWLDEPSSFKPAADTRVPPGSPIGN
jgi:hypothetical protein